MLMLCEFEIYYDGCSVVFDDLVFVFVDVLFEDYGDEWFIKVMFYYCWLYWVDIDKVV